MSEEETPTKLTDPFSYCNDDSVFHSRGRSVRPAVTEPLRVFKQNLQARLRAARRRCRLHKLSNQLHIWLFCAAAVLQHCKPSEATSRLTERQE